MNIILNSIFVIFILGVYCQESESTVLTIAAAAFKGALLLQKTLGFLGVLGAIGKRSVDSQSRSGNKEDITTYLTLSRKLDSELCLPRAICEIMAKGDNDPDRNSFEKLVKEFYSTKQKKLGANPDLVDLTSLYDNAALLGKLTNNYEVCGKLFKECELSSLQLRKLTSLPDSPVCI